MNALIKNCLKAKWYNPNSEIFKRLVELIEIDAVKDYFENFDNYMQSELWYEEEDAKLKKIERYPNIAYTLRHAKEWEEELLSNLKS